MSGGGCCNRLVCVRVACVETDAALESCGCYVLCLCLFICWGRLLRVAATYYGKTCYMVGGGSLVMSWCSVVRGIKRGMMSFVEARYKQVVSWQDVVGAITCGGMLRVEVCRRCRVRRLCGDLVRGKWRGRVLQG